MLVEHAEAELRRAGLLDKDSDYAGMAGEAVLELMKVFAAQGHSGGSAPLVAGLFQRLATYQLLTPLENPTKTGEYIVHDECGGVHQCTRKSSVFSDDGGKRWYDIDQRIAWWKRLLGQRRAYLTFP